MEYAGNLIVASVGIGLSFFMQKVFKKEFLNLKNGKEIFYSHVFLVMTTILGKETINLVARNNIVTFSGGKDKMENEGFIGPLEKDDIFFGPDRKNRQIIQGMKKENRRNDSGK